VVLQTRALSKLEGRRSQLKEGKEMASTSSRWVVSGCVPHGTREGKGLEQHVEKDGLWVPGKVPRRDSQEKRRRVLPGRVTERWLQALARADGQVLCILDLPRVCNSSGKECHQEQAGNS